ncbi:MAG: hypothetical protein JXB00_18155 [Bacteroidales bacterium]|nr:hypothetical protein [Bacteroidales bacterium]
MSQFFRMIYCKPAFIISLAVLLFIFSFPVFAQEDMHVGYIISNSNDTVHGFISLKSFIQNSRFCEFKAGTDKNITTYTPNEINAFRIKDGKYYISKEIVLDNQKRKVFLEFLLKGFVNLYYMKDYSREYFFIEKDSTMYELSNNEFELFDELGNKYLKKSNQYQGALTYLFQEAPDLNDKILNTEFTSNSLVTVTKEYHNIVCKDYKCIEYEKPVSSTIYFEPILGFIFSSMGLGTSADHSKDSRPNVGMNLSYFPDKKRDTWSYKLGIYYSYNDFQKVFYDVLHNDELRPFEIYTRYSILRVPFIIEYAIPTGDLEPLISFGYHNIFILNPEYDAKAIYEINPSRYYYYPMQSDFRKYQFGFSAGLGLKYVFNNSQYIYLKGNYEYRFPSVNLNHIFDYHFVNSFMLNIGYGIKIK